MNKQIALLFNTRKENVKTLVLSPLEAFSKYQEFDISDDGLTYDLHFIKDLIIPVEISSFTPLGAFHDFDEMKTELFPDEDLANVIFISVPFSESKFIDKLNKAKNINKLIKGFISGSMNTETVLSNTKIKHTII